MSFSREAAVDRLRNIVETVATERTAVPVREVWVYGDVVLGLDPVERLDVYVTKDLLFKDASDREAEFEGRLGVEGVGKTVSAAWPEAFALTQSGCSSAHAADTVLPTPSTPSRSTNSCSRSGAFLNSRSLVR